MITGAVLLDFIIIAAFIIGIIVAGIIIAKNARIESPQRKAGRLGEKFATGVIQEILTSGDVLLTNVELSVDGKRTELDNVIINSRGVYIIEVKNYSGELFGTEDDYEWIQSKMTSGGNFYQKQVKNPIRQVNRQIYILSQYLKNQDVHVWIEGYAFLIEQNSPVEHECILKTRADMDRVIHQGRNHNITEKTKAKIISLLQGETK